MVFNSYTFIIFLVVVVGVSWSPLRWSARKTFLLLASYLFYAAWNPPFVALIWLSTIVDWKVAQWIYRSTDRRQRFALLLISLCTNLGLLAYFKYGNFFLDEFVRLAATMGWSYTPATLDIILPVGISFYTFQSLSYTIDVYRGKLKPEFGLRDFALFVTFFPQLVAGPIVRASDFLPQTLTQPRFNAAWLRWGVVLLILGLFQKVVVADGLLAPIVESVYDGSGIPSALSAIVGTLAFAGQILCDFSGYSTIAIGVAMMLGFRLPDNFRFPYAARGFSDFWQRWHISLSSWLRDYLYISLGGNRRGSVATYRNLTATMLLGGLWHGASWNFVFWGGLHGLYLVGERVLAHGLGHLAIWRSLPGRLFTTAVTFGLVCFAWIFFRAETFDRATAILTGLFVPGSANHWISQEELVITTGVMGMMLMLQWLLRDTTLEEMARRTPAWITSFVLALMLFCIAISPGEDRAFIYFQF